ADTPGTFGGLVPGVVIPLAIIWIIVLGVLYKGVKKGIEIANRIMIPLLLIIFLIIVIRAVTLPGALTGLDEFFKPDLTQILSPKVLGAAYGQIFFSMSLAFSIMLTYACYLPNKTDGTINALV